MNLKEKYRNQIVKELMGELGISNPMRVPKIVKITINSGIGKALEDPRLIDVMVEDMSAFAGQKALPTFAKKDISGFGRLKKGDKVGVFVTLRGNKMWNLLEKLVNVVLPNIRNFKGLSSKSFDGRGNYSFGIRQHVVFPESDQNRLEKSMGLQINITTTAESDQEALVLLKKIGLPIVN